MTRVKDALIASLTAISTCWGAAFTYRLHTELRRRQSERPDVYPQYSDLWPAALIFIGMVVAQLLFRPMFAVVARSLIPKQPRWSYALWGAKVNHCSASVLKFIYYTVMTVWGVYQLRDAPWMPWALGGSGDTRQCWTDGYPFQPVSAELRRWYLVAVGYHLSEIALLLIGSRHPDFYEMLLHHVVTCFLVSLSYVSNLVRIGSLVLLLHSSTDVFIHLSKAFVNTSMTRCTAFSYLLLVASYAWFRVFVFPVFVMRSAWIESLEVVRQFDGWGFFNFALCVLLLLHMYWFALIVKMGFHFKRTGQARDMQSNLSGIDLQNTSRKKVD